ncbi:MAG TPA: hypothetical protein EYH50_00620 [Pyrodictium delaneyi]|uniref:Uncharacterized protein n=1 Tax=Pyrodictium delaneyi TaxID=1273541 RepID=A0A833A0U6_9CREN|nr:hypothetical protein [Pyrodictium delaneyi]
MLATDQSMLIGYIVVLLSTAVILTYMLAATARKRREAGQRVVSVLRCTSCNILIKRGFREGDYVGKIVDDKCPQCGGSVVVESIYEEKVKSVLTSLLYELKSEKGKE